MSCWSFVSKGPGGDRDIHAPAAIVWLLYNHSNSPACDIIGESSISRLHRGRSRYLTCRFRISEFGSVVTSVPGWCPKLLDPSPTLLKRGETNAGQSVTRPVRWYSGKATRETPWPPAFRIWGTTTLKLCAGSRGNISRAMLVSVWLAQEWCCKLDYPLSRGSLEPIPRSWPAWILVIRSTKYAAQFRREKSWQFLFNTSGVVVSAAIQWRFMSNPLIRSSLNES